MTKWIIGFVVSLLLGQIFTSWFLVLLRKYLENRKAKFKSYTFKKKICFYLGLDFYPPIESSERHVPGWMVGTAERIFFTFIVAFNVSGTAISMVGWITLKMLAARPHRERRAEKAGIETALPFEFAGLMGNLCSMFFALVGGLIIRGTVSAI